MDELFIIILKRKGVGEISSRKSDELIEAFSDLDIIVKINNVNVYLIPFNIDSLNKLILRLKDIDALDFIPYSSFYNRIRDKLVKCRRIIVYNVTPVIIRHQELFNVFKKLYSYIEELKIRRMDRDAISFRILLRNNDKSIVDELAKIVIMGLGSRRNLGYGSIDASCVNS